MPKHILKRVAGPNVVRVEKDVKAARRKQIVQLQRRGAGLNAPIAYESATLTPKESDALQHPSG